MKFTYRTGQRPLEGYTIKRGLGQGGFGEVYFAVSDAGKEVALKLIRGHKDIELRGIAHCLNLNHPSLVHLYDLRRDLQETPWLIMEYVVGESLAQLMQRQPRGLPEELTCEWFQLLAKGIGYLHDHGVVHRDLKPANVFIENGQPKIGDYGLCKSMTESQGTAQTYNVGTVHYMAPEITYGNYNKQIDIYASGVMLYELLTGRPPFEGESVGEILLKHMTEIPNLLRVPPIYRSVIERSLAKNPIHRFATMAEMAQALELARRPANLIGITLPGPNADRPLSPVHTDDRLNMTLPDPSAPPLPKPIVNDVGTPVVTRPRPPVPGATPKLIIPRTTPRPTFDLTVALARVPLLATLPTGAWAIWTRSLDLLELGRLYVLIVAVAVAVLVPGMRWARDANGSVLFRRLALTGLGAIIGVCGFMLEGWSISPDWSRTSDLASFQGWGDFLGIETAARAAFAKTMIFFMVGLGVLRWWQAIDPKRKDRFTLFPLLAAGFWSVVLSFEWSRAAAPGYLLMTLPAAAMVLQLAAPWREPEVKSTPRKLRLHPATTETAVV